MGFEGLAEAPSKPGKSLQRMLSDPGNPGMHKLAAILSAVGANLGRKLQVTAARAIWFEFRTAQRTDGVRVVKISTLAACRT